MWQTFDYQYPDWVTSMFGVKLFLGLCTYSYHGVFAASRKCQILIQLGQGFLAHDLPWKEKEMRLLINQGTNRGM